MRAVPYGIVCCVITALAAAGAKSAPITSRESVLPPGTELNQEQLDQPTELFASERAGGKRPYLVNLGDLLFSSPIILGGLARQAGISCSTCHQQGHNNPKLFIPGLSSRPGTFDPTNALFEPKSDNHVFDPVTPPSLRGAKHLAPYGHDGRFATAFANQPGPVKRMTGGLRKPSPIIRTPGKDVPWRWARKRAFAICGTSKTRVVRKELAGSIFWVSGDCGPETRSKAACPGSDTS